MSGYPIPTDPPPVLYAVDFSAAAAPTRGGLTVPPGARLEGDQLLFTVEVPSMAVGLPLGNQSFGDAVFQAQLSLLEGADDDLYGIFVRRPLSGPRQGRFACFAMGPAGRCVVRGFDGQVFHDVIDADLAAGMTFAPGLREPNLFQVVTSGPQVTFLLNDRVVIGLAVDLPLAQGELGLFVHHGPTSPRVTIGADWVHVRAIMAPNAYRASVAP